MSSDPTASGAGGEGPAAAGERPRILAIDDEQSMRDILTRILGTRYEIIAAGSVEEGKRRLAQGGFDLVLCDIRMSDGSGLQLLRDVASDTAVVMVTGLDDPAVADEALAMGASGYLLKPFTANELRITVASAIRRRELELSRRMAAEEQQLFGLVAERERIATELHHAVIDHLFHVGLTLAGALRLIEDADARARVEAAVAEIDTTVREIRSTILNPP